MWSGRRRPPRPWWPESSHVDSTTPDMEVLKITPRGYCHGVVDALRIAKRVREETQAPVHMLARLAHSTHASDDLHQQEIALVDQPDRLRRREPAQAGTVISTAYDVPS